MLPGMNSTITLRPKLGRRASDRLSVMPPGSVAARVLQRLVNLATQHQSPAPTAKSPDLRVVLKPQPGALSQQHASAGLHEPRVGAEFRNRQIQLPAEALLVERRIIQIGRLNLRLRRAHAALMDDLSRLYAALPDLHAIVGPPH